MMNPPKARLWLVAAALAVSAAPLATAQSENANTFVNERRADQWLSSGLRAKNVYDRADAKIGSINDLVIDRDGRVAAIVIGVGGFLGIGEKNVGVPFQDVKVSMREGAEWLVLDRTKDDLRAAPAFNSAAAAAAQGGGNERSFGAMNPPSTAAENAPPSK